LLALSCVSLARAENWPQWRGPLGTGISTEKAAPLEWTKDKNIAWEVALPGPGNSTPIVWGDKLFLTCANKEGTVRGTYCFDTKSGKDLWSAAIEYPDAEATHNTNPACSASPVTDGERVIVWHGSAGVFCYDLDGKELWRKDLGKFEHIWGNAASPVIYKDLVILNAGPGLNVSVLALDKKTGNEVWRKEYEGMKSTKAEEYRGSWSTPVIYNDGQRDVLLLTLPERLRAVDPATGEEYWSCGGGSKLVYTSPIVAGDIVVMMCGFHGPAFAVRGGGQGDVTETHRLWVHEKNPQRVGSGVALDGKVYILNEDGIAWCIDAASGEIHWKERLGGSSWSSAVAIAGRVYLTNMSGQTTVIEPSPESCQIVAKNSVDNKTMRASPAFADGRVFLRSYEKLFCVEAK
jgi:outer membrane protein assembly factor BamB